jgi:hypothetical protein
MAPFEKKAMGLVPMAFCLLKQTGTWVQATIVIEVIKAAQSSIPFHFHNNVKEIAFSVKNKGSYF